MSQSSPPLIKASQIDQLPFLDANAKQQYKHGLANLWHQYENNPEGSKEKSDAYEKIRTASQKLMAQLAQRRPQSAGQPRPGSQQQQQGNTQQQMGGQQQPQPGQQMSQQHAQAQAQAQQAGQQGGQQPAQMKLSAKAQEELQSVKLAIPPDQHNRWRQQAFNVLIRRDQIYVQASKVQNAFVNAQQSGSDQLPNLQRQLQEAKRAMEAANKNWKVMRLQGEGVPAAQAQAMVNGQQNPQAQAQGQQQQQRPSTQQGPNQNQNALPHSQQQQSPTDAKLAGQEQHTSLSPAQPQNGFQQAQPPNQKSNTPVQNQQQQPPSQPQMRQQTPQSAMHNQAPQQFPQQQQGNMQQQQQPPRPPQINTQQMPNQAQMGQQQQSGGPQAGMPQSATQPNQQRPQALSQQAAISQAADAYRSQAQGQQQAQQPPPMPNGLPYNNQPQSASQQNTPTYPNLQTQTSSVNTKFPIPKTLALDPRTQTPQAGPPQRPTMQHAGMMFQPGITRPPPYTLEGEGDRVLSKRKLDELVRQVTGAAPASSDSESSAVLSPDVEESILEMADTFVDELITAACRLAKLRSNQTLDIRDVQFVLERNYGIRIPGYSLDEVRTVKKFQPAPGWTQKMQAVQAGKVMGNRDS